jgi:hypothetical protein
MSKDGAVGDGEDDDDDDEEEEEDDEDEDEEEEDGALSSDKVAVARIHSARTRPT